MDDGNWTLRTRACSLVQVLVIFLVIALSSFFDEILRDSHACTHTHTCNPPGPDNSQLRLPFSQLYSGTRSSNPPSLSPPLDRPPRGTQGVVRLGARDPHPTSPPSCVTRIKWSFNTLLKEGVRRSRSFTVGPFLQVVYLQLFVDKYHVKHTDENVAR